MICSVPLGFFDLSRGCLLGLFHKSVGQDDLLPDYKEVQHPADVCSLFCPHLEDALTQRFGKRLTKHRPFLFQKLQRHKYLRLHFHVLRQNELFRRS